MKTTIKIVTGILLMSALAGCTTEQIRGVLARFFAPPPVTVVTGDPIHGESVFREGSGSAPACISCHQITSGGIAFSIGPSLADIAHVASARVEGMSASAYIYQSIVDPGAHLAPGFRNIMYPNFGQDLSPQDIEDLVAFLLTLDGDAS